jgi:D-threo-aldose 1-dehydrogenase
VADEALTAKRLLGRSGLAVTVAGFGAGGLGNFYRCISNTEAGTLLDAAWNLGIRYFDTAPFYGRGRSERRLGQFLEQYPRDQFVLSTKVGRLLSPAGDALEEDGIFFNPSPFNSRYDYSYDGVMRSFESSLHRLGLSRVDILYVHDIGVALHGSDAPAQLGILKTGGLRALEELRNAGDIQAYGLGVTEVDACLDCLDYANPDAFLLAGKFSLLDHGEVKPLLNLCTARRVSLIVGGVFNSGILATGATPTARYNYASATEEVLSRVRTLEDVCARHGVSLSAAALQYPLSSPAVASVLLGVGTTSSLQRCAEGLHATIPASLWRDLEVADLS